MSAAAKLSKVQSLLRVRELGLRPRTVIDVGVATGTNGLYDVFTDARYVLIEPLEESRPFMRQIVEQHPGSIAIHAAAGRTPGEAEFVVHPGLSGSSFLLSRKFGEVRTVPIVTIDGVVKEHGLEGPFILKLDVQGFELEVLEGATETLGQSDLVITEASLWADVKAKAMPRLIDLISWFDQRGFVVYDIAQIIRRKLDDAIAELDLVFCRADSPLRAMKNYKTREQHDAMLEERRRRFGLA
jgi:FkbM family methyltransferase